MQKAHSPRSSQSPDTLAQELEGLIDLGATKQATKVVAQLLRLPRATAVDLWQVVRAICMMERPRRWRIDIESAYARLSKNEQRRARIVMFDYYSSINEPDLALRFCKLRDLRSAHDLMFAMELYLDADRLVEARKITAKCLRMKVDNPFDASARAEALASYYARTKKWDLAYEYWARAPRDQPISRQAVIGGIEILLAWALAAIDYELKTVARLRTKTDPDLAVSLPSIQKELLDQTEKDLLRLKRGIGRIFSPRRQREFGLA